MRRVLPFVFLGIVCATFAACQPAVGGLTEADQAAIRKLDEDWIKVVLSEKPDWNTAVPAYYAQDATWMMANMPAVEGHDAIKAMASGFPHIKDFKLTEVSLEGGGNVAYRHYTYVLSSVVPGVSAPLTDRGKGIEVFRKQADGTWRVIRDIGNSDLPMPGFTVATGALASNASPEVKKLSDIVGRWQMNGNFHPDPKTPAGPVALTMACEWFAGGWQVVCRFSGTMAGTQYDEFFPYSYDPKSKAYSYYSVVSDGTSTLGKLTIQPGTWVHTSDMEVGGKPAKSRFTLANMSAAGGAWKYEVSIAGGPYAVMGEGNYTKAQ